MHCNLRYSKFSLVGLGPGYQNHLNFVSLRSGMRQKMDPSSPARNGRW